VELGPFEKITFFPPDPLAGQAASQHVSPAVFPVESPRTNVAFSSSRCLTGSSLKAVAAMFPDTVATTLPNSTEANSTFGGLTSIPEVLGTSEMPTASKTILKVSCNTSVQFKCDWLSVGACLFNSAINGTSLISCQVSGCNLLIHHACQVGWENGGPGRETRGCDNFCIGHHPVAKRLPVPERQEAGATTELMTSISNAVQQGPTSRRVGSILPEYSSEEEEMDVRVSV
jgi:hypothetical protein